MFIQKKFPIIAFEGMPRSGKTSTLENLLKQSESKYLLLKELYFSKEELERLKDKKGTLKESKWFIDQESMRRVLLNFIDTSSFSTLLVDRMYLSTLAYCYARSKLTKKPEEFIELTEYLKEKSQDFLNYDLIIIFDNKIEITQSERRENQQAEDMGYWMNTEFMNHYQSFYSKEAEKYTEARIFRINTISLSLQETYKKTLEAIDQYT